MGNEVEGSVSKSSSDSKFSDPYKENMHYSVHGDENMSGIKVGDFKSFLEAQKFGCGTEVTYTSTQSETVGGQPVGVHYNFNVKTTVIEPLDEPAKNLDFGFTITYDIRNNEFILKDGRDSDPEKSAVRMSPEDFAAAIHDVKESLQAQELLQPSPPAPYSTGLTSNSIENSR